MSKNKIKIEIESKSIKLSQLLKKLNFIGSGGQAKFFIKKHFIKINGKNPIGKGSKIKINSTIWIDDNIYMIIAKT